MQYRIMIYSDYWEVFEDEMQRIIRLDGFSYLEEAFTHPNVSIPIIQVFFANRYVSRFDTNFAEFGSGIHSEFQSLNYDFAEEERVNALKLMRIFREYSEEMEEKKRCLSDVEVGYLEEKLGKIKKVITQSLFMENNLDSILKRGNHNAFCSITRTMKKLREEAPILYEHLDKTLTTGYRIQYNPELDPEFDLIIREGVEELVA